MAERTSSTEQQPTPHAKEKAAYFTQLCFQHLHQIRLLLRGGGLKKKEGWGNVAQHCIVQLAAAKELCALLELSEEETDAACQTSAIHDWDKRFEKTRARLEKTDDKTEVDALDAQWEQARSKYLADARPRPDLLDATNPRFLADVIVGKRGLTFHQRLQLYLDLMTDENDIVRTRDRYEKVSNSQRSAGLEKLANGTYWEGINALRISIERELLDRLRANNVEIKAPADIPLLVRKAVEQRWMAQK